jgi:D-alanyl-D-alanine carboxypeptidase/D-alanyl-D-alanine-endopeptidase (penicillin-binding protein 4)
MTVVDPVSERVIFTDRVNSRRIPASVAKILTAAATLSALGPQYRVTTPVKTLGDSVYLVGSGDPFMPRASGTGSLKQLAQLTAAALKKSGRPTVTLIFDDSLFSGPALGPGWKSSYPRLGVAAPVSALSVGGARVRPGAISRTTKPARQSADLFAQRLRNQGIKVNKIRRGQTPPAAMTIASVQSRPISELVELMVRDSDNDIAEILTRLVGLKVNGEGSFVGGSRAITSVLASNGITTTDVKVADGSGLSTENKVSASVVASVLTEMVRGDQPQWSSIASGLPVAAETGTLVNRFNSKGTRAGAGVVLAKTGSLTGVSSLAGTVKDRNGRLLVFVLMSNKITSIPSARNTMDRIAATLAKCGCTS